MTRTEMREHIFKMLFGIEFNPKEELQEQLRLYLDHLIDVKEEDLVYMHDKFLRIVEKVPELDQLINEHTTGWKTGRMNKVDLTILRLALYEMQFDDDIPMGVAINEAVELAKRFSGDEGPAFVNGVLAKLTD